MKKLLVVLLAMVVLVSVFAGCGAEPSTTDTETETETVTESTATDDTTAATNDDTLNIGIYAEIASLDSAYAYDFTTNPVVIQITESLLYYDNNNELQNGLCESWEEVDDKTYVYNVRQDVTFSDGTPMTMEDVMFSLSRYQDPEIASYLAWMYANVESIEQTGDFQFTVKLSQADALWKHTFATTGGHIHSKKYIEEHADNYGTPEGGVLGTGPYKYESWDVGSQIVLSYNENYWNEANDGEPEVKNVVFQIISEDTTRVMASTSGQIDINLSTPVEMLEDVNNSDKASLVKIPSIGLEFLSFNCAKAPFDDVNVRRAIAYAIDNEPLQENVIKDFGTLPKSIPVPESLFLFEKDTWMEYADNVNHYDYDLEKAKACMAESAYPDGFECTISVDEKSVTNSVALVLQQALSEIGITASIEKVSNDEIVSLQFGSGIDENGVRPYDIAIFEWSSDFPDPSGVLTPLYASANSGDGGSNSCAYSNEEVDELFLQQAASTSSVERTELMLEALDIINDEVPNYVYTHQNWLFTTSNRISGGVADLQGTWFWNLYVKDITLQ